MIAEWAWYEDFWKEKQTVQFIFYFFILIRVFCQGSKIERCLIWTRALSTVSLSHCRLNQTHYAIYYKITVPSCLCPLLYYCNLYVVIHIPGLRLSTFWTYLQEYIIPPGKKSNRIKGQCHQNCVWCGTPHDCFCLVGGIDAHKKGPKTKSPEGQNVPETKRPGDKTSWRQNIRRDKTSQGDKWGQSYNILYVANYLI